MRMIANYAIHNRVLALLAALVAVAATLTMPPAAATAGPAYENLCPPPEPGKMTCAAVRRTDVASSKSPNAAALSLGLSPGDLAELYRLDRTRGAGRTVAVLGLQDDPHAESDLAVYRANFGLPPCTTANGCFRKVNSSGETAPLPDVHSDWSAITAINIEMVSAVCPLCHILLVEVDNEEDPITLGVDYALTQSDFLLGGWGSPEHPPVALDAHYDRPGKAIVFPSLDIRFAEGPKIWWPASLTYVTAVGGTTVLPGTSSRFTERAWADDSALGGCSAYSPQPGWQISGIVDTRCPRRATADVAAVADPATGVSVYDTYGTFHEGWIVAGGTEVAASIVAGIYALAGPPSPGDYAAFYPYRHFIGRGPSVVPSETVLNDITSGGNEDCETLYCRARVGWDGLTGVGTPIGIGAFRRAFPFGAVVAENQTSLVNSPVSFTVRGVDGTLPYTWSAANLPPGLSINSATGVISGTPTTLGTFRVTITGHDVTSSPPGVYSFNWTINAPADSGVPRVIGMFADQAKSAINAAGLKVGSEGNVVNCDFLKRVADQSPAAGTRVPPGSAVNLVYGIAPRGGCP